MQNMAIIVVSSDKANDRHENETNFKCHFKGCNYRWKIIQCQTKFPVTRVSDNGCRVPSYLQAIYVWYQQSFATELMLL